MIDDGQREHTTHVRPDATSRFVSFMIESLLWSGIWFDIRALLPERWDIPFYLETIHTWPLFVTYKTLMLWKTGSHLGQMFAGYRIVDYRTGSSLTLPQAFLRTAPEFTYEFFVPLLINLAMVFLRDDHRHTFDLMAGTIAVEDARDETEVQYVDDEPAPPPTQTDPKLYRESERPPF